MNAAQPSSPQEVSPITSFPPPRTPFRFSSGRAPSWESLIALLVATLLGVGLVILLSPVLVLIGLWLAGASGIKFLSRLQNQSAGPSLKIRK